MVIAASGMLFTLAASASNPQIIVIVGHVIEMYLLLTTVAVQTTGITELFL